MQKVCSTFCQEGNAKRMFNMSLSASKMNKKGNLSSTYSPNVDLGGILAWLVYLHLRASSAYKQFAKK